MVSARVDLRAEVDLARGGRWTRLRCGDRDWLWHRSEPARDTVRPGDAFRDAGGLEECIPTVRGMPDHGSAWSRPWRECADGSAVVACEEFELTRTIRHEGDAVVADYRLAAAPGWRFIWAAHALLDVSEDARILAPAGTTTRVFSEGRHLTAHAWTPGAPWQAGPWPEPLGIRLDRCGPVDGTAVGAVLTDCPSVEVHDRGNALALTLQADGQPVSVALWRNLGGFPPGAPYRSIGVEPMLGRVFDLADARPGDAATVPDSGSLDWHLVLSARDGRPA
jgi:hypothetical protein